MRALALPIAFISVALGCTPEGELRESLATPSRNREDKPAITIKNESDRSVMINLEQTSALDVLVAASSSRTVKLLDLKHGTIVNVEDVETGDVAEGWIEFSSDEADSLGTLRVFRDSHDHIDFRWPD
ncbi:hypothetical protein [Rhodopirellula sp. P2]|uniref:hypothetical protein n=1 Tax=Rhodopirellula sp. P2 TaxID=2127060 RepID=UPI002368683B|nr:hypothetical protein [Rhodopirellula sp. P2]WDQ19343.1 hypothetical protein PSR62_12620 [Rhodopirellula sp. P2]